VSVIPVGQGRYIDERTWYPDAPTVVTDYKVSETVEELEILVRSVGYCTSIARLSLAYDVPQGQLIMVELVEDPAVKRPGSGLAARLHAVARLVERGKWRESVETLDDALVEYVHLLTTSEIPLPKMLAGALWERPGVIGEMTKEEFIDYYGKVLQLPEAEAPIGLPNLPSDAE